MPNYTVFLLDDDGRICASSHLVAADDVAALDAARLTLAEGQLAEVWSYSRMVGIVRNGV